MNKRIGKVLSVLVVVTVLVSSFVWAVPATASGPGDGQWVIQDIPTTTKNVILNGSSIADIAVGFDGKTIYVANSGVGAGLPGIFKSSDAGQSFDAVTNNYVGGAPVAIAVASDDGNTVAVTDSVGVFITKDGGTTWAALPAPAFLSGTCVVTDIVVCPARTGTLLGREYVIAMADSAANTAKGDVEIIGNTASWATVGSAGAGANYVQSTFDFTSLAVSPNFLGDRCVAAVGTANAGATTLLLINTSTNSIINNPSVATTATGVPLTTTGIVTTDYRAAGAAATAIAASSIALPTNFDPTNSSGRRCYVGTASQTAQTDNNVYRVEDTSAKELGLGGKAVKSIAYSGTVDTGILFMGPVASTDILYTTGMTSTSPTWTTTLKGPTGSATAPNVVVRVASDYATTSHVFAGTAGAESGFSISNDAGVSFNQESLIDTGAANIGSIRGMIFTTDARTAFINTRDTNNFISIWRSGLPLTSTSWSRILSKPLVNTSPAIGCSLKLNPVPIPPLSIFFMETTTVNGPIYVSQDGGVSFATRNGPFGVGLKTLSVRDGQTLYYVDAAANIYKSTNAGWTWGTAVPTGVVGTAIQGYRIILPKANQLVIAGSTVAISNDDAASFTLMNSGLPNAVPNVFPMPPATGYILSTDTKYAENNIIYATDTGLTGVYNIYRIQTDNTSNTWENLGVTIGALAGGRLVEMTVRSSVLYAMTNQFGAGGGALRTLYPTDLVGNQNWQALSAGLTAAMGSIGAAPGIVLWASDVAGAGVYAFNDYLATTGPTLTSPDDNYNDAVNPTGGNGYTVDLKWKPMGTGTGLVDRVDVEIVDKANGFSGTPTVAGITVSATNPVYSTAFALQPNHVYQWRIRAARMLSGQLIDSPWSDARTINVQAGSVVSQQYAGPVLLGPQGGAQNLDPNLVGFTWAPITGATEYTVIVATDAALTKAVSGTPAKITVPAYQATELSYGTTYFWAIQATKPTTSIQTMGTFTTMQKPVVAPTAPATGAAAPVVQPTLVVQAPPAETPAYIWAVIVIGAVLVIAVIILIVRTRRVP